MNTNYKCLKNTPSICYIFFAIDDVTVTSVNTYTPMMGITLKISTWSNLCQKIRNMEQSDCLMFSNKNWSLGGLKARMKNNWQHRYCCLTYWVVVDLALSTQYVCCQFFPVSAFSPSRLQFLLGNSWSNRFAPYFLFSCKKFTKYLSSMLIPIIDVRVLTDVTVTLSMAKNM